MKSKMDKEWSPMNANQFQKVIHKRLFESLIDFVSILKYTPISFLLYGLI